MKTKKSKPQQFEEIGKALAKARGLANMTQEDLATKLGFESLQMISNIERGIAKPPLKRAKRYAETIGMDLKVMRRLLIKTQTERIDRFLGLI